MLNSSHDRPPKRPHFLTKTAAAGAFDRIGLRHPRGGCSGFGEGRRAALHHGAGGRKGRGQRRVAVSVFSEQGGDPVPVTKRRMAADQRNATRHPGRTRRDRRSNGYARWSTLSFDSECDEAAVRVALDDAAPLYRDAPEARKARESGDRTIQIFMKEALPAISKADRALAGDLITTTLSAVGKHFSGSPRKPAEIEAYAEAMGRHVVCLPQGHQAQRVMRADVVRRFDPTGKSPKPCPAPRKKYFCFHPTQIIGLLCASHPSQGAYRDRHGRWDGMRWTRRRF